MLLGMKTLMESLLMRIFYLVCSLEVINIHPLPRPMLTWGQYSRGDSTASHGGRRRRGYKSNPSTQYGRTPREAEEDNGAWTQAHGR